MQVKIRTSVGIAEAERLPRIDALKIDVEGYEDRVLMPFFARASRELWPRRVFMEHRHQHLWQQNLIKHMKANGYVVAWSSQHDTFLTRD